MRKPHARIRKAKPNSQEQRLNRFSGWAFDEGHAERHTGDAVRRKDLVAETNAELSAQRAKMTPAQRKAERLKQLRAINEKYRK